MTKSEIQQMLVTVRQAYRDSLDGKSVSFTGLMAGQLPTMTPKPCVTSLNTGKDAGALSQTATARSNSLTFCKANHGIF